MKINISPIDKFKVTIKLYTKRFGAYLRRRIFEDEWNWKQKLIVLAIFIGLLVIDIVVKQIVFHYMPKNSTVAFIPHLIAFQFILNSGMAYGLNSGNTGGILAITFVIFFITLFAALWSKTWRYSIAFVFIAAGGLGNIIDRLIHHGQVVDFIYWLPFAQSIFNTADMFIFIGVVLIVLFLLVDIFVEKKKEQDSSSDVKPGMFKKKPDENVKNESIVDFHQTNNFEPNHNSDSD